jgi:thiamine-monophosphate kinase
MQTLDDLGERGLIRLIRRMSPARRKDVALGIGDDTAVVRTERGLSLLTKDLLVEDIDFRRRLHPAFFIGRKSLAVNLSDIAAMGGTPKYALLGLGLPGELPTAWVRDFLRGFRSSAGEHDVDLIGGDVSKAKEILVSVTIVGESESIIRRTGARPGDWIFVSGTLGDAALGFDLIERRGAASRSPKTAGLRKSFLNPEPRLALGRDLARLRLPSAMIDVSDGLSVDLMHLCEESGTGAEIEPARLPLSSGLLAQGRAEALSYALHGGEDFELLFSTRPTRKNGVLLESLGRRHAITPIGRMVRGKGIAMIAADGKRVRLPVRGFEHFGKQGGLVRLRPRDILGRRSSGIYGESRKNGVKGQA